MAHAISRNLSLYALASFAPTLANLEGVEGSRTVVRAVCETAAWFPFEIQGAIMLGVMSVQL